MPKAKFWCFTSFKDEHPNFCEETFSYITYQRERCPTSSREHWQGYVECKRSSGVRTVKDGLGDNACHLEPSRSTATWFKMARIATLSKSVRRGQRTDLERVAKRVRDGGNLAEIATEFPVETIKFGRGIQQLIELNRKGRDGTIEAKVIIYWGKTGTGKTRRAFERFPTAYFKPDGKWFDNYNGEDVIIFDDFNGHKDINVGMLLRICDRYPMTVEKKGSSCKLNATTFVFTSNLHWKEWYNIEGMRQDWIAHWDAFERRITEIEAFDAVEPIDNILIM
ncbi:replication-associated protein [Millipede associated circular virus 1]|uniref:replication-associated protein n=1 Tax=Millipede associated circular virus 1 TaxID=2293296 RepID=UPI000E32EED3|nr:replication-associated protein [Millipede associated circular virus 1]AXL65925.1 replication-associated protein [Millipede associated circular virus 1]